MSAPCRAIEAPIVRVGSLALVSMATALVFGRVFRDGSFIPVLLLAALIPHAVGLLARLRNWPTARTTVLGAAATALALVWIVAGATTAYGLPTRATGTRLAQLLHGGWAVFRTGIAPVSPTTGVVLLCAFAVATSALAADAIARRPDVTLGALAPTLVLFVLTATLGTDALRISSTVAYVAAALVALVIANAARVTRRRTWFTGRRLASDAATVRSAALVGGFAILAGVVITPLVPGVDSPALVRYRNRAGSGGAGGAFGDSTISPLVDLKARLGPRKDIELFRVTSPIPRYWRLVALDRFDGQIWSLASKSRDATTTFQSRSAAHSIRQQYAITGLGGRWVPAAFTPVRTTMGNARIIPRSSTLIAPNPISGANYEIQSRVETAPSAAQIDATTGPVPASVRDSLELPNDFPDALRDQARTITAGAATPYARAQALQSYFTSGSFTYDVTVDLPDSSEGIGAFLRTKRGFCQQFAAAFAGLARAVGLPARVVVGFTPGDYDATNREYVVRGRQAHAWAEVWLAGLGWRTFEPTPAGSAPGQADTRTAVAPTAVTDGPDETTISGTAPTTAPVSESESRGPSRTSRSDAFVSTQRARPATVGDQQISTLAALAAATVGGLVAWAVARRVGRRRTRRRRRDASEASEAIAGAWRDALDACFVAGLPVTEALTPAEQVQSISTHGAPPGALAPLRDLAHAYADTRFSHHAASPSTRDLAWAAADEVRAELLAGVGPSERIRRSLTRDLDYAEPSP